MPWLRLWTDILDDAEALDMLDRALKETPRQGMRTDLVDNVNEVRSRPDGNSRQRAIRTLREKRPDLHALVVKGEKTPHRAMIEAGLRDDQITISKDPLKASRRILRHFEGDRLASLVYELTIHLRDDDRAQLIEDLKADIEEEARHDEVFMPFSERHPEG
jgi:hypothetical protein